MTQKPCDYQGKPVEQPELTFKSQYVDELGCLLRPLEVEHRLMTMHCGRCLTLVHVHHVLLWSNTSAWPGLGVLVCRSCFVYMDGVVDTPPF